MQYDQNAKVTWDIMEELNGAEAEIRVFVAAAIIIVAFLLVFALARLVTDFSRELRLLNIEIERAVGAEREHYIRRRRRLWLSLLPFIRYRMISNGCFFLLQKRKTGILI